MKINNLVIFFFIGLSFLSCSKENIKKSVIKEKSLDLQVLEAYEEGKESLELGDVLYAAKKFNEAEILFPNQNGHQRLHLWQHTPIILKIIMDTIAELERFLKVYPKHKNIDYAYYYRYFIL